MREKVCTVWWQHGGGIMALCMCFYDNGGGWVAPHPIFIGSILLSSQGGAAAAAAAAAAAG